MENPGRVTLSLLVIVSLMLSSFALLPFLPTASAQTPTWTDITPTLPVSPPARNGMSMVYDQADGYVMMFGGSSPTLLGDTWAFSGTAWKQLSPAVFPSPRGEASMVYDAADGYVLLFGGSGSAGALGDTWKFSAGQWTQLSPQVSPSARWGASIAYDAADGYVVFFGGASNNGNTYYQDTWKFSAGQWTPLSPSQSPSTRERQRMVFDTKDNYVLMFGGTSDEHYSGAGLGDTWEFSGGQWTQLSPSVSPSDRYDYGMAYDSAVTSVVLFGGWVPGGACGNDVSDTWEFSGGAWSQVATVSSPPALQGTGVAYDPSTSGIVLFGGGTNVGASPSTGCGTPGWQPDMWLFGGERSLLVGVQNVVNVIGFGVDNCAPDASSCSTCQNTAAVQLVSCFTIQQNSWIYASGPTPSYLAQNVIEFGQNKSGQIYAGSLFMILNGGNTGEVVACSGQKSLLGNGCDFSQLSLVAISVPATFTLTSVISGSQLLMSSGWVGGGASFSFPCSTTTACSSSLPTSSFVSTSNGFQPQLDVVGPPTSQGEKGTQATFLYANIVVIGTSVQFLNSPWSQSVTITPALGPGLTEYSYNLQVGIVGDQATFTPCQTGTTQVPSTCPNEMGIAYVPGSSGSAPEFPTALALALAFLAPIVIVATATRSRKFNL